MRERDFAGTAWQVGDSVARETAPPGLLWRWNRLRCMTPAEVGHRALRALTIHAERLGLLGTAAVPQPDLTQVTRAWIRPPSLDPRPYLEAADRIAAGRLDVFALSGVELGSPPAWNRDPKSGVETSLGFGKLLDYRDPRRVGEIKYLWELNRHSHLVTLAQAYALSGDARYFGVIRGHLQSWFAACPYKRGANWSCAFESAIRLINWSIVWELLGGVASPLFEDTESARFRDRWLESVFRHAQFVRGYFSLYSSANNHLIGEAAGVYLAALTWPHWRRMRAWGATAKAILEREVLLQNAADGVNREQAVSYQQFELDLLLIVLLAARANGQGLSAATEKRIEAMLEYLASIMDSAGNVPMIGDSDDGCAVRLAQGAPACRYRSLLASGAILLRRGDLKAKAGVLDDKTRWLFGQNAHRVFEELDTARSQLPVRRAFPEGGYYILGCDFETDNEIRLVADAGPLGYQTIAAHGHADALAFTLSVGGEEFLIDPGTYTYRTQGPWREYFRGTAAHNTLRVDGLDQSQPGGSFMWLRKAEVRCTLWQALEERDVFEAWHDGYMQLLGPVIHRRRITLEKRLRRVVIEDSLQMSGAHEIELFFHCSERCRVESLTDGCAITRGSKTLVVRLPSAQDAAWRVCYGSVAPVLGWVSRRFDHRQPASTIAWRARLARDTVLRSEIVC